MNRHLVLVALLALSTFLSLANAAGPACAAKRIDIESQLSEAKARGRSQQVAGLNRALRANEANCTDESLAKDREARIQKARRELAQRENDLASAERAGSGKKIEKRRAKLEEARRELADAEKPLAE
jgi:hypothetical protein